MDGNARTEQIENKVGQQDGYELTNREQAKLRTKISDNETSAEEKLT
jgi:hypothetical protein